MNLDEFEALLNDDAKSIEGDISWQQDEDHSHCVEFRVQVRNTQGRHLFARGSFNHVAECLTFCLLDKAAGRIYGLDLGKDHKNPDSSMVGEKHKHRLTAQYMTGKFAYVPDDITAPATDPCSVWHQFCIEAKIKHRGTLSAPPPMAPRLFT